MLNLKDSEDSDVVTLTGYVLDNYHNIQLEGETIKLADLDLKIQDYRHSYIDSFIVTTLSKVKFYILATIRKFILLFNP